MEPTVNVHATINDIRDCHSCIRVLNGHGTPSHVVPKRSLNRSQHVSNEQNGTLHVLFFGRQPLDHLLRVRIWRENGIPNMDNLCILDGKRKSFD